MIEQFFITYHPKLHLWTCKNCIKWLLGHPDVSWVLHKRSRSWPPTCAMVHIQMNIFILYS